MTVVKWKMLNIKLVDEVRSLEIPMSTVLLEALMRRHSDNGQ